MPGIRTSGSLGGSTQMEIENQGESSSSGDELELKKQAQLEKIKDFNFIVADVIQAIEKTN